MRRPDPAGAGDGVEHRGHDGAGGSRRGGRTATARWLWGFLAGLCLLQASVQAAKPLLSYRILEFGQGEGLVAFLPAALSLGPAIVAVSVGRLIDRRRPATFAWLGAFGLAVGGAVAAIGPTVVAVFAGAVVVGFGQLLHAVAAQEIVAAQFPAAAYDRGFGLIAITASIGRIAGPTLGGFFGTPGRSFWDGPASSPAGAGLVVASAVAAAGLALLLFALRGVHGGPSRRQRAAFEGGAPPPAMFRNRDLVRATVASLAIVSAIDILIVYMPVLGERYGMTPLVVGGLLSLRASASIVSKMMATSASGRYDRRRWLVISLGVAAVGIAVLPFAAQRTAALVAAVALFGLALGPAPSWTMAWVAEAVPSGRRATALAFRIAANRFGQAIVPAIAGGLAGALGLGWVFAASSALLAGVAGGIGMGARKPRP